ncbi:MAG: hypothetical protein HY077_09020 [Elusimicrobia bacterium]|nr:hypothetical protein [Elusimicrobiota bacterium]
MKRTAAYASLIFLSLLAGCPNRQTAPTGDYDSVRQKAGGSMQTLEQEKGPQGE